MILFTTWSDQRQGVEEEDEVEKEEVVEVREVNEGG